MPSSPLKKWELRFRVPYFFNGLLEQVVSECTSVTIELVSDLNALRFDNK